MVGPISSIRTGAVGGVSRTTSGGSKTKVGKAMNSIAGKLGAAMAGELDLLGDRQPRKQYAPDEDLYEVDDVAKNLNAELGGSHAQQGMFARSLGDFVIESASLMAARPESRSLKVIADAIAESEADAGSAETADTALRIISQTTAIVAGKSKPR